MKPPQSVVSCIGCLLLLIKPISKRQTTIGLQRRHQQQWLVFFEDQRRFPPASLCRAHHRPQRGANSGGSHPQLCQLGWETSAETTKASNSLVGNGFHIPCIMALLSCIPQLLAYKVPPPWTPAGEVNLREEGVGQVRFGNLESWAIFPDLITPTQAIAQDLAIHDMVWDDLLPRLQACRVTRFQFYSAWMRQRGREWSTLGPTPLASEERAKIFSGLSGQRFSSGTHPKDLITFCHPALERNPTYDPQNFHRLSNQKVWPRTRR